MTHVRSRSTATVEGLVRGIISGIAKGGGGGGGGQKKHSLKKAKSVEKLGGGGTR